MAGGIVSNATVYRSRRLPHFDGPELLTYVAQCGAERCCLLGELGIVGKQVAVGGEHCPAPAGVCDDRSVGVEGRDVPASKVACAFEITGMGMQGAATDLFWPCSDDEIVGAQYS